MGYEPRLIAPYKNSLVKYYSPWIIGDDAFPNISNAYTWRGKVRKREGYSLFGSFPGGDGPVQGLKNWVNPATLSQTLVAFSTTLSYIWNISLPVPAFQNINFLSNPAGQAFTWSNTADQYFWTSNYAGSMWTTNNIIGDHIRYWIGVTGAVGVSGGWSIFQPTVNGTTTLDASLIVLPYKGRLVVLNTSESNNLFPSRARWSQIGTPYTSNSAAVGITGITAANPAVVSIANTTTFAVGQPAGILDVLGSMGSLLNFNQFNVLAITPGTSITIDVDTTGLTYTGGGTAQGPGTTVAPAPFQISIFGWRDDIPGRGGYIDADTSERIVSAEIVKDTLIVFFQRSTWRLRYTGNEILPFIWERLNTQLGAESTFSNIAFDEAALVFSRYGWIAADTNNVARIDLNIPDDCFSIEAQDTGLTGLSRVHGIRDFYRQFAYWTFPAIEGNNPGDEADQIYCYNYIDKTWSIFTPSDPIRTFGTYIETQDETWGSLANATDIWSNYAGPNDRWEVFGSAQNIDFPIILGGDASGNVYEMFEFGGNPPTSDNQTNFGFEIDTKRFNPYITEGKKCRIGYVDLYCTTEIGCEITFQQFVDDQQSPVVQRKVVLYPRSLVDIASITAAVTPVVTTVLNHSLTDQQRVSFVNIVGTLAPILNNKTFIATVTSATTFTIAQNTVGYTYTGGGQIYSGILPNAGDMDYVRIYLGAIAHMHQFKITLNQYQIEDPIAGVAQFEMHGMVLWTKRAGMIRG
jgi:hypothetical protein